MAVAVQTQTQKLSLPNGTDVDLVVRRSSRAQRILLQVGQIDGAVELVVPSGATIKEALSFAGEKAEWVERRLDLVLPRVLFAEGVEIPYRGVPVRIRRTGYPGTAVTCTDGELLVPGREDTVPGRVKRWFREQARHEIVHRANEKAERLGRPCGRITIRDQRTRWGSCSANGNLNFSWRLILAPETVLDYVVAHEIAHLAEMNHGPRFWAHVGRLCTELEASRAWLRARGASLHRIG